jgi:hypothetical protein
MLCTRLGAAVSHSSSAGPSAIARSHGRRLLLSRRLALRHASSAPAYRLTEEDLESWHRDGCTTA